MFFPSLEHAPPHRRASCASFPQAGVPAGLSLATGGFLLVTVLPEEQLLGWGWRLPFLFSAVLVVVAPCRSPSACERALLVATPVVLVATPTWRPC